ncbi:MAG: hypothetical protein NT141_02485 [candidate division WWE3 bacterium]|nr:hypothetical protein [candidate division WWE3 bacterium]
MKAPKISKATYEAEIKMCRDLSSKQGHCNWGTCDSCGSFPLLYKLYKGELLEDKEAVKKARKVEFEKL